jgi:hypothetical protein
VKPSKKNVTGKDEKMKKDPIDKQDKRTQQGGVNIKQVLEIMVTYLQPFNKIHIVDIKRTLGGTT